MGKKKSLGEVLKNAKEVVDKYCPKFKGKPLPISVLASCMKFYFEQPELPKRGRNE